MSARDELRKVIVDHSMRSWSSTRPQDEKVECWCGWTGDDILGHQLDQILARYAVVELPEANQSVTIGGDEWNVDESTTVFAVRNRVEFEGHAVWSESPEYAQTLAAALLAAARNAKAVEQ